MNLKMPIVFDNDCLCSFSWINRLDILDNLFTTHIVIPDIVMNEISFLLNYTSYCYVFYNIEQRIKAQQYRIEQIPVFTPFEKEYKELTDPQRKMTIGKGEAAAIIIAKRLNGTLASNNLQDILPHIKPNYPPLITTETILYLAYQQKIITMKEGQQILQQMKQRHRFLSTYNFGELIKKWQNKNL
ncbi:Predicted nucleic acid-binding protein, contains PIN domain [Thermoanaerobacter thermohydrosulfuricus]|uniref:Predicted nucleic acid-binding protein, contains PIN domain n=1 Tax=Thermoanaerobacter thermohydrosulfuricus TaxID=1516 RepID=A0A1G7WM15_THETY|nr:hypothetical protein [Thermoanaerobacter thermohydrosulfuricus]SDG72270.1 Predicted nucleic acid-binding protein, contains PIN domain [Thermoanaerobacter thermohydrosulfuricus]